MRDGLVVVDKPAGCTSHDVVAKLRKAYGQRRVGHAGTLDPDATGVLLVGLGRATRLLRFLQEAGKSYRGTNRVRDRDEHPRRVGRDRRAAADAADARRRGATRSTRFVGDLEQLPPMVSAVKVGGRRLHQLARAGVDVERAPRRVRVDRFEVEDFEPGPYPEATVLVECGSGTYVRSLAADLGVALGGCAHLATLRRLAIGSFTLAESHALDDVVADPDAAVLSLAAAMRDLERVDVDDEQVRAARHGIAFPAGALGEQGDGPFALVGARRRPASPCTSGAAPRANLQS